MRRADSGIQDAHIVVNLGDGGDGRARIIRARFLVYGNSRRKSDDLVYVRLLHAMQELPRISRQRFDIATLSFGKNRIEGQRRFSRAGKASYGNHMVPRHLDCDIFQVMRASAFDDYFIAIAVGGVFFVRRHKWRGV